MNLENPTDLLDGTLIDRAKADMPPWFMPDAGGAFIPCDQLLRKAHYRPGSNRPRDWAPEPEHIASGLATMFFVFGAAGNFGQLNVVPYGTTVMKYWFKHLQAGQSSLCAFKKLCGLLNFAAQECRRR